MKNRSFYVALLTLLVLISVAVWQFFTLVARGESWSASEREERDFRKATPAALPKAK